MRTRSRHESDTIDLLEGRFPAGDQIKGGFAQAAGTELARRLLDRTHRLARADEFAHFVVEDERFRDRLAATVARTATLAAAFAGAKPPVFGLFRGNAGGGEQRRRRPFLDRALRTCDPDQALCRDPVQRAHETVGIQAHVHEPADHVEDVVGVHRGENQVSGQRRLHRYLRGFRIADLPHHDLVRVVPQNRAQAAREGKTLFFVYRNLQDSRKLVFDRIFYGDDLVPPVVNLGQDGVKRGRLAAAGRAGHQQHPIRLARKLAQPPNGPFIKAEYVHPQSVELVSKGLLVENAQDRVLSEDGRHDGDTEVHLAALDPHLEAAILGNPAFGDVELGHDFHARHDLLRHVRALRDTDLAQHPGDAVFDREPVARRFEMNVACPGSQCVVERGVYELYHRARVFADGLQRQVLHVPPKASAALFARYHAVHRAHVALYSGEVGGDVVAVGKTECKRPRQPFRSPGLQIEREGVANRQEQLAALVPEGDAFPRRGFTERQHVECRHQLMQHLDRSSGEFEQLGQRNSEFGGRELEVFLEHLDHPAIRRARLRSRFLNAGRRQDFATR